MDTHFNDRDDKSLAKTYNTPSPVLPTKTSNVKGVGKESDQIRESMREKNKKTGV